MDFKRATSLFIFVFIIINIALGLIYYQKVQKSNIKEVKSERVDFEREGIKIPKMASVLNIKMNIVSGRSLGFAQTEDDFNKDGDNLKTSVTVNVSKKIKLKTIEPNEINDKIKNLLRTEVDKGKEYVLSGIDRKNRKLYFDQVYNEFPILNNDKAQIVFSYNKDNEITKYKQSYLKDLKEGLGKNNEKKKVIPTREALEVLYYQAEIERGDEVRAVRLGYYSIVREVRGQVLKPTYQVEVLKKNGDSEMYYVDALNPEQRILK